MARVISISNQKGGVGKTTTSINLAACLAVAEKRVLLIDMDAQGNAGSGLGITAGSFSTSIYNVIVDERPIREAIQKTELDYLDIAPADQDLAGAEIELVTALGRESRLKDALEPVLEEYDYVIIDCPPTLGLLTINALAASDSILIPLQCEYYAMEGLSQLLQTSALIQKKINPQLRREGILLTMYDRRNNLAHQVEQEVRKHFGDEVFETVIPRNVKLSEAPSHGKPIVLYDISSAGANAYMGVAKELIRREKEKKRPKDVDQSVSTQTSQHEKADYSGA